MNAAIEILNELEHRGVVVRADGDDLYLKPKDALDDALLAKVRQAKPAILTILRNRPATCSPSCYIVDEETGAMVHHPWNGCSTPMPPQPELRKVEALCWHCSGTGRCGCSTCWTGGPGECVTCRGGGKTWAWVQ